jgi:hypothetical protein
MVITDFDYIVNYIDEHSIEEIQKNFDPNFIINNLKYILNQIVLDDMPYLITKIKKIGNFNFINDKIINYFYDNINNNTIIVNMSIEFINWLENAETDIFKLLITKLELREIIINLLKQNKKLLFHILKLNMQKV